MPYDLQNLRDAVRGVLQNVPPSVFTDANLDVSILQAKRRLDLDYPNIIDGTLTGTGKRSYQLSGVLGSWVQNYSQIKSVLNPTPDLANDDLPYYVPLSRFKIIASAGQEWLQFSDDTISTGKTATVEYTVPWVVKNLDGAVVATTLTDRVKNALEFLSIALASMSLSGQQSGSFSDQIAGADLINFTKQDEYQQVAEKYEALYLRELNLDRDRPRAIMMRGNYPTGLQDDVAYMTHRNRSS